MKIQNILKGRIDRVNYILSVLILLGVLFITRNILIFFVPESDMLLHGITYALLVFDFVTIGILSVRRLHDMGKNPRFIIVWFVPMVNIAFCILLMIGYSEIRTNHHGHQVPRTSSLLDVLLLRYDKALSRKSNKTTDKKTVQVRDDIL